MNRKSTRNFTSCNNSNIVKSNRSQSGVITTVLIILIVLAAVFIVYVAVRNMVKSGTEKATTAPLEVSLTTFSTNLSQMPINVSVTRQAGKGNITAIKIIFKNAGGDTKIITKTDCIPGELETKICQITADDLGGFVPVSYELYPVISSGGREIPGLKAIGGGGSAGSLQTYTFYFDSDKDGYGNLSVSIVSASQPENYVANSLDCDDSNFSINPGSAEVLDKVDNDCDNLIDEQALTCGTVISQDNSRIILDSDLENCPSFGIMIDAGNVTLDCNFHEISGSSMPEIYNSGGKEDCSLSFVLNQYVSPSGVAICRNEGGKYHIKNCNIHGFNYNGGYGGAIANYDEHPSSQAGIIENNTISNSYRGIMQWGEFDTIRNNKFENLTTGIFLDESSGSTVENNAFLNNYIAVDHYCGAYCDYKQYPTNFSGNIFKNNTKSFYFRTSSSRYINDYFFNNKFSSSNQEIFAFQQDNENITLHLENNTLDEKEIFYAQGDMLNQEIRDKQLGLFYCRKCSNLSLANIIINNKWNKAAYFYNAFNVSADNIRIINSITGISLKSSSNILINASFESVSQNFVEEYPDGTNRICNIDTGECYQNFCANPIFSGLKNDVFSLCTENEFNCLAHERWCNGADVNHDSIVNSTDSGMINLKYGQSCSHQNSWCENADTNTDGAVDTGDTGIYGGNSGRTNCNLPENILIKCFSLS